ncbi:hypothetical protein Brsp07_03018 [Brucella sp. NBRC 14130]|uniref:helix-turn-helix transcriptional regulator n=1 Tax=Brucella sp. NBRC 14130 TaxID=3075483 RepID=UPI0030A8DD19
MQSERILVTKEIASRLGCSERTVKRMFQAGKLPGAFKLGERGSPVKMSEGHLHRLILASTAKTEGD